MFKSKIFNSVMRYMLVAMLALQPNTIWADDTTISDVAYLQECKDNYGNRQGVGVTIDNIESLLLAKGMLAKSSDGTQYDVKQKPLFLKISIFKKDDNTLQDASIFTIHRGGQYGFNEINTSDLSSWPNVAYKAKAGVFYYSGTNNNFLPQDIQFRILQGTSQDLSLYTIKVEASNDVPTIENNLIVSEPTNSLKIIYTIKERPFKHYKGYANADGDYEVIDASKNQLRQKVSTWEYTYVVDDADHKTVSLMLPIQNFESSGDALEPLGYFRWYNYDTDNASANLSVEGSSSLLNSVKDADNVDKGLMAFNLMEHATQKTVGVKYTRPNDPNWKGETIACDVSRYIDGIDATGTYMEHEPTLSIRYIFHIIPSTQMAEILKKALVNDSKDLTFEDNKNVTVGFMNDNSKMTLRLDFVDPTMYYFYPVTNTKHVYYPAGSTEAQTNAIIAQRKITDKDFSSDIKKAATIEWRAYNGTRDKMCILGPGNVPDFPRFFDLSINLLNGANWTDLDGGTVTKPTFNPGDHFYVVAYVKDESGNCSSPMANFSIRYFHFYPKTFEEMGAEDVTRQISYLDENYNNIAVVSFDNDSPEQTLSAPTSPDDNQSLNSAAF